MRTAPSQSEPTVPQRLIAALWFGGAASLPGLWLVKVLGHDRGAGLLSSGIAIWCLTLPVLIAVIAGFVVGAAFATPDRRSSPGSLLGRCAWIGTAAVLVPVAITAGNLAARHFMGAPVSSQLPLPRWAPPVWILADRRASLAAFAHPFLAVVAGMLLYYASRRSTLERISGAGDCLYESVKMRDRWFPAIVFVATNMAPVTLLILAKVGERGMAVWLLWLAAWPVITGIYALAAGPFLVDSMRPARLRGAMRGAAIAFASTTIWFLIGLLANPLQKFGFALGQLFYFFGITFVLPVFCVQVVMGAVAGYVVAADSLERRIPRSPLARAVHSAQQLRPYAGPVMYGVAVITRFAFWGLSILIVVSALVLLTLYTTGFVLALGSPSGMFLLILVAGLPLLAVVLGGTDIIGQAITTAEWGHRGATLAIHGVKWSDGTLTVEATLDLTRVTDREFKTITGYSATYRDFNATRTGGASSFDLRTEGALTWVDGQPPRARRPCRVRLRVIQPKLVPSGVASHQEVIFEISAGPETLREFRFRVPPPRRFQAPDSRGL